MVVASNGGGVDLSTRVGVERNRVAALGGLRRVGSLGSVSSMVASLRNGRSALRVCRLASTIGGGGSVLLTLALGAGSGCHDRSGCRASLALGARSRAGCGSAGRRALGARGRLSLAILAALERSGAGVDGGGLGKGLGGSSGRGGLSDEALRHSVGLCGSDTERDLAGSGDGRSLGGSSRLNNGLGGRADVANGRAVSLAVVGVEKRSHIRELLAFRRHLSNGCAGRGQEDERAGKHYD